MITDDEIDSALEFMRNHASKAAQARANRIYVEEFRKTLKAQLMREHLHEAVNAQERDAYADQKYVDHLQAIKQAVFEDERYRFLMAAAEAKISAWQTQCRMNRPQP